jgi:hypothetical protein
MAFTLSGSIITQSGTDADLSGLSGVSGVTTTTLGAGVDKRTIYSVGNRKLIVQGTLDQDHRKEEIVFGLSSPTPTIDVDGGVYTAGVITTYGSQVTYSVGIPWSFVRVGGASFTESDANIRCGSNGTLNLYGCSITLSGSRSIFYTDGARGVIRNTHIYASNNARSYMLSALTDINGYYVYGVNASNFRTAMAQLANYVPYNVTFPLFYNGNKTDGEILEVRNFERYGNTTGDIQGQGACKFIFINKSEGYDTLEVYGRGRLNDNDFAVEIIREVQINSLDESNLALASVKFSATDVNNGNRINFVNGTANTATNYVSDRTYSFTTDGSGVGVLQQILTAAVVANDCPNTNYWNANPQVPLTVDDRGLAGAITFYGIEYTKSITAIPLTLAGKEVLNIAWNLIPDANITEATKATVDAYTSVDNAIQFYDRAKAYLFDNYVGESSTLVTRSGNAIDAGAFNVNIDATASSAFAISGNTITIKAGTFTDDMTTTGVITLANGAVFNGTRTDANGTVLPLRNVSVTGLTAGSRLRVYNETTSAQIVNAVVSGTSYTATYAEGVGYSANDVLSLRVTKIDKLEAVASVVVSAAGWTALVSQDPNTVYAAHGVNGATVTGISWDGGDMHFDFNETDNVIDGPDIGAWYQYLITTEIGIAEAFGALNWPQINRLTNVTSKAAITWDNTKSTPLQINNVWANRDDGVSIIAATSNSIQINPPAVFVKETATSGLTSDESTKLDSISLVKANTNLIPALL